MGEVYLAVDQRLGSAVALKRTFFSEDSTLGTAFEREARILARLRHPVLPKVIDHFAENGDQFLVMEHISGDDISKRLEVANKPFPVSWVMFWSDQMLDALAYLHSHEPPIVHRDIKPQNLKLTDDNHIVLLDFGLSKDFDSNSSGLNSASVAGYSPHFASMEQIRGTGTDARSDLYSLAATLYQMLTNSVPPDALTRADSMLGGKGDPIRPLNELNPEVSPSISEVILKAVAIRQDERYGTAIEMQKELRRAFNKGKADPDEKPTMAGLPPGQANTAKPTTRPEVTERAPETSETPEMETQIRLDTPVPLDATLQMPFPAKDDAKQSELKTAVFNIEDFQSSDTGSQEPKHDVVAEEAIPEARPIAAAAAAGVSSPTPSALKGTGAQAKVPVKKSKVGLIVGVVVALFLLVGVGGGAVWYLATRSSSGGTATNTAPVPANTSTPAQSTPAIAVETNTDSNANSTVGNPATQSSVNTDGSNSVIPPVAPTEQKPSQPVASKTPNTKPVPAPPAKTTPKPKAKDDRTTIVP